MGSGLRNSDSSKARHPGLRLLRDVGPRVPVCGATTQSAQSLLKVIYSYSVEVSVTVLSPQTEQSYRQVADRLTHWRQSQPAPVPCVGICGAQGSGKSTLARWLVETLSPVIGPVVALSLDDFYRTRAERQTLARTVHPLLQTRGVPGTHDVPVGIQTLGQLTARHFVGPVRAPRFDKSSDDRAEQGLLIREAPALVLFEGWCVGLPAEEAAALAAPVNDLERTEDADGSWRGYVNAQLAGSYAHWFGMLDAQIFLDVPGWDQVRIWRAAQEQETAAQHPQGAAVMDAPALERFLAHYERLTRHALAVMPARADMRLRLDTAHNARLEPVR